MKNSRKSMADPDELFICAAIGTMKKMIARQQLDPVHSFVNLEVRPHLLTSWKTGTLSEPVEGDKARDVSRADMFIVMLLSEASAFWFTVRMNT